MLHLNQCYTERNAPQNFKSLVYCVRVHDAMVNNGNVDKRDGGMVEGTSAVSTNGGVEQSGPFHHASTQHHPDEGETTMEKLPSCIVDEMMAWHRVELQ